MLKLRKLMGTGARKAVVRLAVVLIALMSGYISYGHIKSVATHAGESVSASAMYPLIIDFTMILSSVLVFEDRRMRRRPRIYARLGQIIGLSASVLANLTDAVIRNGSALAIVTAVAPAIFLFFTSEMLMHSGVPLPKRQLSAAAKRRAREARTAKAGTVMPQRRIGVPAWSNN